MSERSKIIALNPADKTLLFFQNVEYRFTLRAIISDVNYVNNDMLRQLFVVKI